MKHFYRAALVTVALLLPGIASAACFTAPTYSALTGKDASSATQTMQTFTATNQVTAPLVHGWLMGGTIAPFELDANCYVDVDVQASALPTGAATSALQTTINTTLGTPMQNSGGSVTANAGTNLNTSLLALESGGNLAAILAKLIAAPATAANQITAGTPYHLSGGTAATNNLTLARNAASTVYNWNIGNTTSTTYFFKVYDLAATPTDCTSTTGLKHVYPIANASGLGATTSISNGPGGEAYVSGVVFCVVAGQADNNNTSAVVGLSVEANIK